MERERGRERKGDQSTDINAIKKLQAFVNYKMMKLKHCAESEREYDAENARME